MYYMYWLYSMYYPAGVASPNPAPGPAGCGEFSAGFSPSTRPNAVVILRRGVPSTAGAVSGYPSEILYVRIAVWILIFLEGTYITGSMRYFHRLERVG